MGPLRWAGTGWRPAIAVPGWSGPPVLPAISAIARPALSAARAEPGAATKYWPAIVEAVVPETAMLDFHLQAERCSAKKPRSEWPKYLRLAFQSLQSDPQLLQNSLQGLQF